ncbi:MAG: tRNA uridine-5-carboxymethylaminomethyl(34) synthesis GTPase MnmE, partial [Flavobacteriaceae bacterium]
GLLVLQASLLIYLYERNQDLEDLATEINSLHHEHLELFLIENKIDLYPKGFDQSYNQNLIEKLNPNFPTIAMGISTFEMKGLTQLKRELVQTIQRMGNQNAVVVNNIRHFHALGEALNSIENVTQGLKNDLPGDLLSIDLKEAIEHVGAITGKIDPDQDVLGTIFGQFCIGK